MHQLWTWMKFFPALFAPASLKCRQSEHPELATVKPEFFRRFLRRPH